MCTDERKTPPHAAVYLQTRSFGVASRVFPRVINLQQVLGTLYWVPYRYSTDVHKRAELVESRAPTQMTLGHSPVSNLARGSQVIYTAAEVESTLIWYY